MSRRKPKRDSHIETRAKEVKPNKNSAPRLRSLDESIFVDPTQETGHGEGLLDSASADSDEDDSSADTAQGDDSDLDLTLPEASEDGVIKLTVESRAHGWRLDHYLNRLFSNHSRGQLKKAIDSGDIVLNGLNVKASRRLRVNDRIDVRLTDAEATFFEPEAIPLEIIYEDDYFVIVNKPSGMVVHPGRGAMSGTLTSALQHHFDQLSDVGGRHRPGIVHRLDRDTTGVILVAKDNQIHQQISRQFEERTVKKEYRAIVRGVPELDSDYIKTHVCTHIRSREKMMVCAASERSREAVTFYNVAEKFAGYALMDLKPHTGRTHQLRVHMLHIENPIVADKAYIQDGTFTTGHIKTGAAAGELLIARQALHAYRLTICHPVTKEMMTFEAPFPADFQKALDTLREIAPAKPAKSAKRGG